MSQLMSAIIASATGGIIAGVVVKLLTDRKWIKELNRVLQWIISGGTTSITVVSILILLYEIVLPPPKCEWKLEGTIIDRLVRAPVAGAEVTVVDFSCSTDITGRYLIKYNCLAEPELKIRVARTGYDTIEQFVVTDTPTTIQLRPNNP